MPAPPNIPRRVLVIDDSPLACGLAAEALSGAGYEVFSFTDPQEAVRKLREISPAVVVCDMNMPGLSGVEVVAAVRGAFPYVPVVIYSEQKTVAAAVSALQQGAFRYALKDDNATSLAPEVDRAWDQHLALRRAADAEAESRRYREQLELLVQERTAELRHQLQLSAQEREEYEEQRRVAEARFRVLVERWPDPIAIIGTTREVLFANPTLAQLLGYPAGDSLRGRELMSFLHPEDRADVSQSVAETAAGGASGAPRRERRWLRGDGSTVQVEMTAIPVLWEGAHALMVLAKDITQLKELNAKMMHMDRMVAVGTLAAGVAHEINNPLAYILSNVLFSVQELQAAVAAPEPPAAKLRIDSASAALDDAKDGAERVRDIVRDLKTFSRADEAPQEVVDVHAVLESALAMTRNQIRHRAQVVKDYEELPMITASRSKLAQVFVNLLANAAHAIPDGRADQNRISLSTHAVDSRVEIRVTDTGSGIAPEHLSRIFDPFFTTKPVGEGTGLGLAICMGIVRDLGGEISCQTKVGEGTTFTVSLPIGTAISKPRLPMQKPRPMETARWSILIVDDEPLFTAAVQRFFSKHYVKTARSGREALEQLGEGTHFDAILSDVHMPEMTGIQLYQTIGERWPDLLQRVGFVTGGAISEEAKVFLGDRRDRIFEKPGNMNDLEVFVARLAKTGAN